MGNIQELSADSAVEQGLARRVVEGFSPSQQKACILGAKAAKD
jgi:hypothetical protein